LISTASIVAENIFVSDYISVNSLCVYGPSTFTVIGSSHLNTATVSNLTVYNTFTANAISLQTNLTVSTVTTSTIQVGSGSKTISLSNGTVSTQSLLVSSINGYSFNGILTGTDSTDITGISTIPFVTLFSSTPTLQCTPYYNGGFSIINLSNITPSNFTVYGGTWNVTTFYNSNVSFTWTATL
jgi:hypothetical protein